MQWPDEMGGDEPAERVHLGQRLADEAEVAQAQVAQPAVDQLRRRARRAGREVVALDERDPEPVPGGGLGDAGSDDPAADDEQVEPSRPQALERGCSLAHRCDDTAHHPAWVKPRHPGRDDGRAVDEGGSRTAVSAPDPADAPPQRSRLEGARERMLRAHDWANAHVPGADLVAVALERERIAAAGLLAGGLAYRLFFWLVPLGLLIAAVLSFWVDADRIAAADAARDFGMSGAAVQSAMNAIAEQHYARWYFLLAGLALVIWFGGGVVRALFVAHYVAWGLRPVRLRRPLLAGLVFSGVVVLLMAVSVTAQVLREQLGRHGSLAAPGSGSVLPRLRALGHGQAAPPQHLLARPAARGGARRARYGGDPRRRRGLSRTEDRPLVRALRRAGSGDGDPALALSPRAADRRSGLPQRRALGESQRDRPGSASDGI